MQDAWGSTSNGEEWPSRENIPKDIKTERYLLIKKQVKQTGFTVGENVKYAILGRFSDYKKDVMEIIALIKKVGQLKVQPFLFRA